MRFVHSGGEKVVLHPFMHNDFISLMNLYSFVTIQLTVIYSQRLLSAIIKNNNLG